MGKCLDPHDPNAVWLYCPSTAAAVLFTILFGITAATHIAQAFIYKKSFCWVIIMAALWETTGFALRIISAQPQNSTSLGFFIPQQLLILLAPLWINAFDYMILGRMVHFFLPDQKIWGIKAKRLTVIFVLLDMGSFLVQGIGASMLSGQQSHKTEMLGIHIYMTGIGIQELFVVIFAGLAIQFKRKVTRIDGAWRGESWRPLLYALYASLALITTRIIYRLVEFSGGVYTPLPMHEAYFYCLEALPMLTAVAIMNVWHPGRFLVGPESEFPRKTRAEKKALKQAKKEEKEEKKREKAAVKEARKQGKVDAREVRRVEETKKGQKGGWWGKTRGKSTNGADEVSEEEGEAQWADVEQGVPLSYQLPRYGQSGERH